MQHSQKLLKVEKKVIWRLAPVRNFPRLLITLSLLIFSIFLPFFSKRRPRVGGRGRWSRVGGEQEEICWTLLLSSSPGLSFETARGSKVCVCVCVRRMSSPFHESSGVQHGLTGLLPATTTAPGFPPQPNQHPPELHPDLRRRCSNHMGSSPQPIKNLQRVDQDLSRLSLQQKKNCSFNWVFFFFSEGFFFPTHNNRFEVFVLVAEERRTQKKRNKKSPCSRKPRGELWGVATLCSWFQSGRQWKEKAGKKKASEGGSLQLQQKHLRQRVGGPIRVSGCPRWECLPSTCTHTSRLKIETCSINRPRMAVSSTSFDGCCGRACHFLSAWKKPRKSRGRRESIEASGVAPRRSPAPFARLDSDGCRRSRSAVFQRRQARNQCTLDKKITIFGRFLRRLSFWLTLCVLKAFCLVTNQISIFNPSSIKLRGNTVFRSETAPFTQCSKRRWSTDHVPLPQHCLLLAGLPRSYSEFHENQLISRRFEPEIVELIEAD